MANRRMLAVSVINSARFIKMPIDSQNLYFHLAVRADDDGIVEAFSVMRMLGTGEDNLRVLNAKGFVKILNDDLVAYITDWNEHNLLRPDRKIDSIYKKLLLEVLPEVKIIEPKSRKDRNDDPQKRSNIKGRKTNGTAMGRPNDVNGTAMGPHRLGEVRLVQDSIGQDNLRKDTIKTADTQCTPCTTTPSISCRITKPKQSVGETKVSRSDNEIIEVLDAFREWTGNGSFYKNKTQREAVKRMLAMQGKEKVLLAIEAAKKTEGQQFAPVINTPLQLEEKYIQLRSFYAKKFANRVAVYNFDD